MPPRAEHGMVAAVSRQLLAGHDLAPDRSAQCLEDRLRRALALHLSAHQDRHPPAHIRHIINNVRRQDHGDVFADLSEEAEEAIAFLRVESGGRLVDDDRDGDRR